MNPVTVAAVFITFVACCVAAYVLLQVQAGRYETRYEIQLEALRNSVWREASGRQEAEARVRELSGDEWEQREFWAIAAELSSDEGGAA